jgi:hypothetical protein
VKFRNTSKIGGAMNIRETIDQVSRSLAPTSRLLVVCFSVDSNAASGVCFRNVRDKVRREGGRQQLGWAFQHVPGIELLVAIHHAVWVSPSGAFVEITPHDEYEWLIVEQDGLVFLPDDSATLLNDGTLTCGLARPNRAFPISKNKRLARLARRFNRSEWEYWHTAKQGMAASRNDQMVPRAN